MANMRVRVHVSMGTTAQTHFGTSHPNETRDCASVYMLTGERQCLCVHCCASGQTRHDGEADLWWES